MVGSELVGEMVFTAAVLWMLNLILSGPEVSLDSWIAALKVHWFLALLETSHTLSEIFLSAPLPVRLTVKVVAASAGADQGTNHTPTRASANSVNTALRIVFSSKTLLAITYTRPSQSVRLVRLPGHRLPLPGQGPKGGRSPKVRTSAPEMNPLCPRLVSEMPKYSGHPASSPRPALRRYLKTKFARWTLPSLSFSTNCLQPLHEPPVAQSYS